MKREATDHPKVHDLADALRELGAPHALGLARGVLESLWHLTAKHAPDGAVGRLTDRQIERACGWEGDTGTLVQALAATHWIDISDGEARLIIHGWSEHADDAVHRSLARAGRYFADGSAPNWRRLPGTERDAAATVYGESGAHKRDETESGRTSGARRAHSGREPEPEPEPSQKEEEETPATAGRTKRAAVKSAAPDALDAEQVAALERWAQQRPEIVARLPELVDACLDFHRAKGNRHADWVATCRTWIRNELTGRYGRANGPRGPTARADERAQLLADNARAAVVLIEERERRERERRANGSPDANVRQLRASADPVAP